MDIERAITYPLKDEEWLPKIIIGGLVNIVPIANLAVAGYALQAMKNVIDGQETPLPNWSDFGKHFVKGLLAAIGAFVYAIPLLIIACLGWGLGWLVAEWSGYSSDLGASEGYSILTGTCCGFIGFVYALAMAFVLPAAFTKYAVTDEFSAFFKFGDLFRYIGAHLGDYVVALIVTLLVALAAELVGGLVCGVGLLLTVPWAYLVYAHLFAQVYLSEPKSAV